MTILYSDETNSEAVSMNLTFIASIASISLRGDDK